MVYFTLHDYWWLYLSFIFFIALVLLLDLGIFHKNAHVVSFKEAAAWSTIWVRIAVKFNLLIYIYSLNKFAEQTHASELAKNMALEFTTGFLIEKALAIDNIFIFAIIFSYFEIPRMFQHRILFWGISHLDVAINYCFNLNNFNFGFDFPRQKTNFFD